MEVTSSPMLMLVEDDGDTAALIREVLQDHFGPGCVRLYTNKSDAQQADLEKIDIVLADMNLPDGNGIELLNHLLGKRPDLPVILITGENIFDSALAAIRQGACDYMLKAGDYLFAVPIVVEKNLALWRIKQENQRLQARLTQTVAEIKIKNKQLQEAVAQLQTMAATDPLTGLANRRAFNLALDRSFAEALRHTQELALVMVDLDDFKKLNDTQGHQRGDEILQLTARILENSCRRSDLVGRLGGDEFVVLLPSAAQAVASQIAQRISEHFTQAIAALQANNPAMPTISLSMGIACLGQSDASTFEQLLAQADHALYRAKQAGKTRFVVYHTNETTAPTTT